MLKTSIQQNQGDVNKMIYIGMDDTDTLQTRGTGALARNVAAELARDYEVIGVIRHQLLHDPRVPCTKNNSSKGLLLEAGNGRGLPALAERVRGLMLSDFQPVASQAPKGKQRVFEGP